MVQGLVLTLHEALDDMWQHKQHLNEQKTKPIQLTEDAVQRCVEKGDAKD